MKRMTFRWTLITDLIGLAMIVISLGAEVVLSGLSGGIGPAQIVVIVMGLLLLVLPRIRMGLFARLILSLSTIVIMVIVLELVLGALGFPVEYHVPGPVETDKVPEYNNQRVCDERGCHWDAAVLRADCGDRTDGRMCGVNDQGYSTAYNITREAAAEAGTATRILVLGDSFTWGASADDGKGWIDVMTQQLTQAGEPVRVWNTAFPGTGTEQALLTTQYAVPIIEPDLVILGFHVGNDLKDNLYPVDRFVEVITDGNVSTHTQQYTLDDTMQPVQEAPHIIYYRARGYTVSSPVGNFQRLNDLFIRTRTGTLAMGFLRILREQPVYEAKTREYVRALDSYLTEQGIPLLVMIIPEKNDTASPGRYYLAARAIMTEQSLPFLDSLPLMDETDYQNTNIYDEHWNNQAHEKAGLLMAECLTEVLPEMTLRCEGLEQPDSGE